MSVEEPESMSGSVTPPSFIPSGSRPRRRSRPASADGSNTEASHDAIPPSFTPAAKRPGAGASARVSQPSSAVSDIPQSFQPVARPPRRSSGSSRSVNRNHTQDSSPSRTVPPTPTTSNRIGNGTAAVSRIASPPQQRHHGRAGRTFGVCVLIIAIALILGTFGIWNWVDGKLVKTSWLTNRDDTPASTWLVLGSDEREGGDSDVVGSRTDTILVLTKPKSGASSLISIPRDSLVSIDDYYTKINAVAELYDNRTLVQEVEQITGQKIDHVAQIKFNGLQNVVDALGGIELCYDSDVDDPYSGLQWQAGCHTADGGTALAFSRMRYADANGDFGRGDRQRQVIGAIMKKALSSSTLSNPSKVISVAETSLGAITVDEDTNPYTLAMMALAFRDATGDAGVTGSVYWSDPGYYVDGVGSSVLLDDQRNLNLFSELAEGTHAPGTVGTLAEGTMA